MNIADLVLEGGGAKLPGLLGAVEGLTSADPGFTFHRIAGTSAGAVTGAMIAAGAPLHTLTEMMLDQDFREFEDVAPVLRMLPWAGRIKGLLLHKGMFRGTALHSFLSEALEAQGIRTWGDLRQHDPDSDLPPERRYRLVVIVSDVSRGRMLRLPWDYQSALGVDPDAQSVADAVYASAAIPFFFRPRALPAEPQVAGGSSVLCADGGILSNFPVHVFDRTDGAPARWPTLGVKLSAKMTPESGWRRNRNTLQYALSVLSTMINAHDRRHIADLKTVSRTVFVDTRAHSSTNFSLSRADKLDLFNSGQTAAAEFLSTWHWEDWKMRMGRI